MNSAARDRLFEPAPSMPQSTSSLRIAYITAGAGGMYCGSCMHDNTLARALSRQPGVECLLVPTYTPIRTDEEDVSLQRVFLGGINVYLEQTVPIFRYLPSFMVRWLDRPSLIRWVASRAVGTDAKKLGDLTISMLKGTDGHQRRDIDRLCDWLTQDLRPNLIILSNMLIAGCIPELKRRLRVPIWVTLQGDDIFLDSLPEPFRGRAFQEISKLVPLVDGFLLNSRYYAEFMSEYLGLPGDRLRLVPLGLDTSGFPTPESTAESKPSSRPLTIGFLARLAPEKGLHELVDAYLKLRQLPGMGRTRLEIAGWLGAHQREYAQSQFARLRAANVGDDWHYVGSISRQEKIDFLRGLDVLSVPTTYREPKGLYVLESLAAGVPVVQPAHGAFPELIEASGGGILVPPGDTTALSERLAELLRDESLRRELGSTGQRFVHQHRNEQAMAAAVLKVLEEALRQPAPMSADPLSS